MNQKAAISAILGLVDEIKSGAAPAPTLIKYAKTKRLSPAQLEKLGQVYNTMRSVNFMDKNAMDTRGNTFDLLDTPAMVTEYSKHTPARRKRAAYDDLSEWVTPDVIEEDPLEKAASVPAAEIPTRYEKRAAAHLTPGEAAEQTRREIDDLTEEAQHLLTQDLTKLASIVRSAGSLAFVEMEQDMTMALSGEISADVFGALERFCKGARAFVEVKRASTAKPDTRRLAIDRWSVKDACVRISQCRSWLRELTKAATTAEAEDVEVLPPDSRSAPSGYRYPNRTPEHPVNAGSATTRKAPSRVSPESADFDSAKRSPVLNAVLSSSEKAKEDAPKTKFEGFHNLAAGVAQGTEGASQGLNDLLLSMAPSKHPQRAHDDAASLIADSSNVQRLILSDDIISQADPARVLGVYKTLRQTNPAVASDINVLRLALREALQYEGVPMHTLSDLTKTRESEQKGKSYEIDMSKDKYKVGDKPAKPHGTRD